MSWIWSKSESRENRWVCFVRDFELEEQSDKGILKIAVDTKYWLYVNENLVVFEGGIKRGPGYQQTYYDEIDITDYLVTGKNRIAILVWYLDEVDFHIAPADTADCMLKGNLMMIQLNLIRTGMFWIIHPMWRQRKLILNRIFVLLSLISTIMLRKK